MSRDLFGGPDLFGDGGPLGGGSLPGTPSFLHKTRARQAAKFPAAPAAVAEPAKADLIDRGVSGLGYVASVLDKPGRAVRGVLAGNNREALAALPFSDSIGLTDDKQAVSPEDLLVHHGLLDKADPKNPDGFFSTRTLKSLGAGILTDPLTLASFGGSAATKAGVAARAAGLTKGWGHRDLIRGFTHSADDLLAGGATADEVAHIGRAGGRVAPAGSGFKANEPLAGAVGVGLPFRDPAFTLGHGNLSRGIAGAFDKGWDKLKYAPGVRTVRQWFDTGAGRSADEIAQRAHEVAARPLTGRIKAQAGVNEYGQRSRFAAAAGAAPLGSELEGANVVRNRAEGMAAGSDPVAWQDDFAARQAGNNTPGVADPNALGAHFGAHLDDFGSIGGEINRGGKDLIEQGRHYGADPRVLHDTEAEYARRQYLAAARKEGVAGGAGRPERMFGMAAPYDRARAEVLKDVPGGTHAINTFGMDPRLSGPARTLGHDDVRDHLLSEFTRHQAANGRSFPLSMADTAGLSTKADQLSDFLYSLDPLHAANKLPVFNPDAIGDFAARTRAHGTVVGNAAGAVEGLASGARPAAEFAASGADHVPLTEAMKTLGLTTHRPWAPTSAADLAHINAHGLPDAATVRTLVANKAKDPTAAALLARMDPAVVGRSQMQGYDGAAARLYEQMARHGAPLEDLKSGAFDPEAFLANYSVSRKDLGSLGRYMNGFSKPHELNPFLSGLDSLQSMFKAFTYPLWPAAHVRNTGSIAYNNAINGGSLAGHADAINLVRGNPIDASRYARHMPAGLTPQGQAEWLKAHAYGHAGVGSGGSFNEVSRERGLADFDTASGEAGKLMPRVPLSGRSTPGGSIAGDTARIFGDMLKGLGTKEGRDLLGVRGVGGRADDTFAPLVAGRKVGENIEDTGRMASFLDNLANGMNPEVAGGATNRVHFDYGDLTPMERNYFRKLVPFYTFMRKNLPEQARLINQRPNAIAPVIRAAAGGGGRDQGRDGYVPDYLASGPAINLGKAQGPDGKDYTRFVTGTGLPMEEALERLKFKQWDIGGHKVTLPDVLGTGQAFAGMANGYMKAPLELMTDTQLHTGRRLSELYKPSFWNGYGAIDGPVGDALSEVGQNLPGTRFGTTFSKLIDDRKPWWAKALNLGTGVKISDVDTDKAYNLEARKAWEAKAENDPRMAKFSHYYVKPDVTEIDPALKTSMQVYSRMQREAAEATAKKKQGEMLKRIKESGLIGGTGPGA